MPSSRRRFLSSIPGLAASSALPIHAPGPEARSAVGRLAAGPVLFEDEEDLVCRRKPDIHRFPFLSMQAYRGGACGACFARSIWFASVAEFLAHVERNVLPWMDWIMNETSTANPRLGWPTEVVQPVVDRIWNGELTFRPGVLEIARATQLVDPGGGYEWSWDSVETIRTDDRFEDNRYDFESSREVTLNDPPTDAQLQGICEYIHEWNSD